MSFSRSCTFEISRDIVWILCNLAEKGDTKKKKKYLFFLETVKESYFDKTIASRKGTNLLVLIKF